MKEILCKETIQNNILLDDFLEKYHFSRKQKHLLKQEKRIKVNQKIVFHNIHLYQNDTIEINCFKEESDSLTCFVYPLDILYEDDIILIINKPKQMIIHSDANDQKSLDNAVQNYYQKTHQNCLVRHIHRLDKDTTGCILYCKNSFLQPYFDYMMTTKQIKRTYIALVKGIIDQPMTINTSIGKDRHANRYRVSKNGQKAITHVQPIKQYKDFTLIECTLETGRTHQIRVHLSSIGHPLIGDELYGAKASCRCMLHSSSIFLFHPLLNKNITIHCKLPNDMKKWIKTHQ